MLVLQAKHFPHLVSLADLSVFAGLRISQEFSQIEATLQKNCLCNCIQIEGLLLSVSTSDNIVNILVHVSGMQQPINNSLVCVKVPFQMKAYSCVEKEWAS